MKYNIHTIPAPTAFVDGLAHWLLERYGQDPLRFSQVALFLPSVRAVAAVRDACLRASGGRPLLLPKLEAIGSLEEDALLARWPAGAAFPDAPQPGNTLKRLFTLAHLIQHARERDRGHGTRVDHAVQLARQLADLLDEIEREGVDISGLKTLVPEPFAAHWQVTAEFLRILSEHWPAIAATERIESVEANRNRMLLAYADAWLREPPLTPVLVAGVIHATPAVTSWMKALLSLKEGHVILPGLDRQASPEYFEALEESHPQWGLKILLEALNCPREAVQVIGAVHTGAVHTGAREVLLSDVMRPALAPQAKHERPSEAALQDMEIIECRDAEEEAGVIALLLREILETPEKTAALVTLDRNLARRVTVGLTRFGVTIDDSAGVPLARMPGAAFLRLLLRVCETDGEAASLLALLKHPLFHAGLPRPACLAAARRLEMRLLRGIPRAHSLQDFYDKARAEPELSLEEHRLIDQVEAAFAPLLALFAERRGTLSAFLAAHIACAEALAGDGIWAGRDADALTRFLNETREAAELAVGVAAVPPHIYPGLFDTLLTGQVWRPEYGTHPRLHILGPLEARLQHFDRVVLGGLNEGVWPPEPLGDPWFNRAMRQQLGLPAPERRIGIAAHDFVQLCNAPEVILTRAEKQGSTPTTPARWLVKLKALLGGEWPTARPWTEWARALDRPPHVTPHASPAPRPPLGARPRVLSITQAERLVENPYRVYAETILGLRPLRPLGEVPGPAEFGTLVHAAFERFVRLWPGALPEDAYAALMQEGRSAFAALFHHPAARMLWWPRFTRMAEWFVEQERERRPGLTAILPEVKGQLRVGDFLLNGRADRVECDASGQWAVIDYKTGAAPTKTAVTKGEALQLPLFALILQEGQCASLVKGGTVNRLEYWKLKGGKDGGEVTPGLDASAVAQAIAGARAQLEALLANYGDPATPYRSALDTGRAGTYDAYLHLARVKEWE